MRCALAGVKAVATERNSSLWYDKILAQTGESKGVKKKQHEPMRRGDANIFATLHSIPMGEHKLQHPLHPSLLFVSRYSRLW